MKVFAFLSILLLAAGCGNRSSSNKETKLVVLVSIDQMRGDYYDKIIKPAGFTEGLSKIFTKGAVFSNAHHNHATTTTAAGHAALATGFFPCNNGIVNNTVYNRKEKYSHYSILDSTVNFVGLDECELNKVSAVNLLKPSIGDYIKSKNRNSKSYSVALKDRASILMGGHVANRAFWFDAKSTQMVSTDYYTEAYPDWAKKFTAEARFGADARDGWYFNSDIIPPSIHPNDSFEKEKGTFSPWFPHTIESFDTQRVRENFIGSFMWNTPLGDAFVLDFAKELIAREDLGKDENTDVLTVGLSAADVIGHHFGPNSMEVLNYYETLDKHIGSFISYLDSAVGKDEYLLVLTADHGVAAMPELLKEEGIDAYRIPYDQFSKDVKVIDSLLQIQFGLEESTILKAGYNGVEPNFKYLVEQDIDSLTYTEELIKQLKTLDYIREGYSFFDYEDQNCKKVYIDQMRNSHRLEYEYFVKILGKENYLVSMRSCGTTHGSPYSYDTHVPIVFYNSNVQSKVDTGKVETVDIVPTILSLLEIKTEIDFDGTVLEGL
ncbi:MAG: alkaline phosphatase family protein [Bacteroidia bacterium]